MIVLEPVTVENNREARRLSVAEGQAHLIASVTESLADAYVWTAAEARVARNENGTLVGFVMVFPFELSGEPVVNIVRFLVDTDHQGVGVGRELMAATLGWIRSLEPQPARIRVSTFPENERALRLYRTVGFVEDGIENGEVVLWGDFWESGAPSWIGGTAAAAIGCRRGRLEWRSAIMKRCDNQ